MKKKRIWKNRANRTFKLNLNGSFEGKVKAIGGGAYINAPKAWIGKKVKVRKVR